MKRFLTVVIVGLLSFGFFACTKKDEAPNTNLDQAVQAPNPEAGAPAAPAPGAEVAPAPAEAPPGS